MTHHRLALATITAAIILDITLGLAYAAVTPRLPWWHGLFCALANAVTDGGDIPPVSPAGYAITAVQYLTVVPLFAATFSLFTSGLTSARVRVHLDDRLPHHLRRYLGDPGS